jgi:hypothetical protein
LIRTIFDTRYLQYFNRATRDVPLLYALYFLCIPLVKLLRALGASPTQVTHLSNVFAFAAICSLIWAGNPWWFPVLWIAALCLDVADGMLARANASSSASGSFYDHVSDQIKMVGLFLAVGLRYDDLVIWVLAYVLNGAFLLSAVINQVNAHRRFRLSTGVSPDQQPAPQDDQGSSAARGWLTSLPRLKKLARGAYLSVFAVYGNSMLLLVPLSFGRTAAILTMSFFSIVMTRSLWLLLVRARRVNQQLARNAVAWKS